MPISKSKVISQTVDINGKTYTFKTGLLAEQANGAVEVRLGDTIVLATAVTSRRDTNLDYFPLFVEYQEKLYAGGKIKGSRWVKREGRPSDEAILTARLIDRSVRPLFSKDYKKEVQIIVTVLSVDGENDPDTLAILAASAALSISDIPWEGPIGAFRVGLKENVFFTNPSYTEREFSDLDLIVSGRKNSIAMVEAGANQIKEKDIENAFKFVQTEINKTVEAIEAFTKKAGKTKLPIVVPEKDTELISNIQKTAKPEIEKILADGKKGELDLSILYDLKDSLIEANPEEDKNTISSIVDELWKKMARQQILDQKVRPDGRKPDQIRDLFIQPEVLPRTHGSAIFQRGKTQSLSITTLGSPSQGQLLETMVGEETKRYIHHYFMPPYSAGETGRVGWPSRREIGHGALAERALLPVIPSEEKFPYTIRVVSEITSCNGSTSMASVCGSTLSLMDAGVPIKKPVAGIAMGLIIGEKPQDYVILTDIMGAEDHLGDMDFKVTGTAEGITALQMDIKVAGLKADVLSKALVQANKARAFILQEMLKVLPEPRTKISKYAPKIAVVHINPEKIGDVIGGGGKTIRNIINTTGCTVDVEDDGSVTIGGNDPEAVSKAINWVEGLTREIQVGEEFEEGIVKRVQGFGIFVEVLPGKEGLVHVSRMPENLARQPESSFKVGQKVKVKATEIDNMGRLNLSMLFGEEARRTEQAPRKPFNSRDKFSPSGRKPFSGSKKR